MMFGFHRIIPLTTFFLITAQSAFSDDSDAKMELEPRTLELEFGIVTDSIDEVTQNFERRELSLLNVRAFNEQADAGGAKLERTWLLTVSLPEACDPLRELADNNSSLSKKVEVLDQVSFNKIAAGTSYCNRHSIVKSGAKHFIKDFVSQEPWEDLKLSTIGFPVDINAEGKCRLSKGKYSYNDEVGELNCLDYAGWYYVEVYDHVYRDMNADGYRDLVLFTALDGSWSAPPKRSTKILTRTSPIDNWQLISKRTSKLMPAAENERRSEEFNISEFPALATFDRVSAFQKAIDDYVQSCIDKTYGNSKAIECFVGYELWDRELNKYYQMLIERVPEESKIMLRASQRLWLKDRDKTIDLNSTLLDRHYEGVTGTMYTAMRASDVAETITPMVRQRALVLKQWLEMEIRGPWRDIEN